MFKIVKKKERRKNFTLYHINDQPICQNKLNKTIIYIELIKTRHCIRYNKYYQRYICLDLY